MKILVVDDEPLVRSTLKRLLLEKHQVVFATSIEEAEKILDSELIDLAFVDLQLEDYEKLSGIELLSTIQKISPATISIVMTGWEDALNDAKVVQKCIELGAVDYLAKPVENYKLQIVIEKAKIFRRLIAQNRSLRAHCSQDAMKPLELNTRSAAFQQVLDKAKKLKNRNVSILIRGESGVGKDLLAKYLWSLEGDDARPFIPVNCAVITPSTADSELFGHKRGTFTDAKQDRKGKFEDAHGGDIFLDEVATLSMEVQQKLLRVLNDGEYVPLGANKPKRSLCRVIAATNENLEQLVKEKLFREDLLFRLNTVTLTVPPLRERKEDIPSLISLFLADAGMSDKALDKEAIEFCVQYRWPGNIRELRNTVWTAALLSDSQFITKQEIRANLQILDEVSSGETATVQFSEPDFDESSIKGRFTALVACYEGRLIEYAISKTGSETTAAKLLGIPRSTLNWKRRQTRVQ
ncbi:MAG: sigma-54-dependent transcriptional regulator [Bacteriovoracia bacterium]